VHKGLLYYHPGIYNIVGRLYYRKRWIFRYCEVAQYISPGDRVLELCAGDGVLKEYLPHNDYTGLEFNPVFVNYGIKKGRNLVLADVLSYPFPKSDVIIMISSFYHFINKPLRIVNKMKEFCQKKIIVCENYKCLSTAPNKWLSNLGKVLSATHLGTGNRRWAEDDLVSFFKENNFSKIYCKNDYVFGVWENR